MDDSEFFLLYVAVLLNEFFPKFTSKIITITPLIGVILTTLLCASPVSWTSYRTWSSPALITCYNSCFVWKLTFINFSDWASFWSLKNSRSTIDIASSCFTCCCICYWLLDFKIIIWWIHITHDIYRVWDAGKPPPLHMTKFIVIFLWSGSIWAYRENLILVFLGVCLLWNCKRWTPKHVHNWISDLEHIGLNNITRNNIRSID